MIVECGFELKCSFSLLQWPQYYAHKPPFINFIDLIRFFFSFFFPWVGWWVFFILLIKINNKEIYVTIGERMGVKRGHLAACLFFFFSYFY